MRTREARRTRRAARTGRIADGRASSTAVAPPAGRRSGTARDAVAPTAPTPATAGGQGHRPYGRETQTDEYRQTIPPELLAWGCDAELWARVKKKNSLRRLARLGDEEHGRKRIAALRQQLLDGSAPSS